MLHILHKLLATLLPGTALLLVFSLSLHPPHLLHARRAPLLSPEALLAATLSLADVQRLAPDPERWWPTLPEFHRPGFTFTEDFQPVIPGEQFYVVQRYVKLHDLQEREIQSTLILIDDGGTAMRGFAALPDTLDRGGRTINGPAIGDDYRYFIRSTERVPLETTLRFRVGQIIGRISVAAQSGDYESAATLAAYAAPVIQRVHALLAGELAVPWMPSELATRLPPASLPIGPLLGSAVVPLEAWSAFSPDPEATRDRLDQLGASELGLRTYGAWTLANHAIDAMLFPFRDEQAALAWVQELLDERLTPRLAVLNPGKTGPVPAFVIVSTERGEPSNYELQFAVGRFVADVSCYSLFAPEPSPDCEALVRELAEAWYQILRTQMSPRS